MDLGTLVGKTVIGVYKDTGSSYDPSIWIDTLDGVFKLEPEGDCCASCYIEHIESSDSLLGPILEVLNIDSKTPNSEDGTTYINTWGHSIRTLNGVTIIEMRLEHNGYYGGRLNCFEETSLPLNIKQITDF